MPGSQRLLANNNNAIRNAIITSDTVASSAMILSTAINRSGNGSVSLSGNYTGAETATFDIEIVDTAGSGNISTPVFRGSGSGTIIDIGPGNLTAQNVTVTLIDTGIPTTAAALELFGVTLVAKTGGAPGNNITIAVSEDVIVKTATNLQTFDTINSGTATLTGPQWDFGASPLSAGAYMSPDSTRFVFGSDPQVYRQYKKYEDNCWKYVLVPAPASQIAKGTAIYTVSGAYDIAVSDGEVTEVHGCTTIYDFFVALQGSALLQVSGAVTKDLSPGGMATLDLPLKTAAYNLTVESSSGEGLVNLTINPDTATEKITLTCINSDVMGGEIWDVSGVASGVLANAITGIDYDNGPLAFTIPSRINSNIAETINLAPIRITKTTYATRATGEKSPPVCLKSPAIGAAGTATTLTATWTKYENKEDCKCDSTEISGRLDLSLLGLEGGGFMGIPAEVKTRLQTLYAYRKDFIHGNTSLTKTTTTSTNIYTYRAHITNTVNANISLNLATLTNSNFKFNTQELAQAFVQSFVDAGWTAGSITYIPVHSGDVYVYSISGSLTKSITGSPPATGDTDIVHSPWIGTYSGLSGDTILTSYLLPATTSSTGTITKTSESQYTTSSNSVTTDLWAAAIKDIAIMEAWVAIMIDCLQQIYTVSAALDLWDDVYTACVEELDALLDLTSDDLTATPVSEFILRYQSMLDQVYIEADIMPKKANGSTSISAGSWTDMQTDYWAIDGYAPVYNNLLYYSTKFGSDGVPYNTKEFAFALAVKCPLSLKYGDQVQILIAADDSERYHNGDKFVIPVIAATPLALSGGQDGDDTVTWRVMGSVIGEIDSYQVVHDSPVIYLAEESGLTFKLTLGGIPFALGDQFAFTVEGGHFRWRKNSGTWSESADIATTSLSDGLSAIFSPGIAPGFVAGDSFSFSATQPAAPGNVAIPDSSTWSFSASSATLTAALATASTINAVAFSRLTLPSGATIALSYSLNGTTWTTIPGLTAARNCSAMFFTAIAAVTHIKVTITNATGGGSIGWLFAGLAVGSEFAPDKISLRRQYDLLKGSRDITASYLGSAWAGSIEWQNMPTVDFDGHLAIIEHCKINGDEPLIFTPHYLHPAESVFVKIQNDTLDIQDLFEFHPNTETDRYMSLSLPFSPVWR